MRVNTAGFFTLIKCGKSRFFAVSPASDCHACASSYLPGNGNTRIIIVYESNMSLILPLIISKVFVAKNRNPYYSYI